MAYPLPPGVFEYINRQVTTIRECSSFSVVGYGDLDRFAVFLPYCGKHLKWDFMYDGLHLANPPDFILPENEEDFLQYNNLKTIQMYDYTKQDALLRVVLEIFENYKEYQKNKVRAYQNERIQFECSTIEPDKGVEFLMENNDHLEVRFLVPLDINLNDQLGSDGLELDIPLLDDSGKPLPRPPIGSSSVTMLVSYKPEVFPAKIPDVRLNVPPLWERTFSRAQIKMPQWIANSCLMEFTVQMRETVMNFVNMLKFRKGFIIALIGLFGHPVEYDSVFYSKISFFYQEPAGAITCVLFTLPENFPEKMPPICLLSHTYTTKGNPLKPVSLVKDSYPWSPRWPLEEMARRIQAYLTELDFKKYCIDESGK